MRAEIPSLPENPFSYGLDVLAETAEILDVLEFCWRHVGEPVKRSYHDYFQHFHLDFDRDSGQHKYSEEVNRIFSRNGLAYTLTDEGIIERLSPPVLSPNPPKRWAVALTPGMMGKGRRTGQARFQ